MKMLVRAGMTLLAGVAMPVLAQEKVIAPAGFVPKAAVTYTDGSGNAVNVSTTNPLPVTGSSGGGGGDASAANQTTQITAEQAIRDRIGALTSPAAGSLAKLLTDLLAAAQDTTTPSPITSTQLPSSPGPKSAANSFATTNPKSTTAATTSFSASTTSGQALAANGARNGCNILNNSTAIAYVRLGSTAATSSTFDYFMAGSVSGVPASFACPSDWTGAIQIISASATGTILVSERSN